MGLFWPGVGIYCQNDEVSPGVHPHMSREVVVRYPLGNTVADSSSDSARYVELTRFSDILNDTGLY